MEKISQVTGMPVVCLDTGERAGTVESVICNGEDKVLGFLINAGRIGSKYGFVLMEDIVEVQSNGISVSNKSSIISNRKEVNGYRKNGNNWVWLNRKAKSDNGEILGIIKDGMFDVSTGRVSQIELSRGIMEDLRDGRRKLKLSGDTEFGTEFIILKTEVEKL